MPRLAAAGVIALIGIALLCPLALADADPASDILLAASVFYPYTPPVSNGLQTTLNAEPRLRPRHAFRSRSP